MLVAAFKIQWATIKFYFAFSINLQRLTLKNKQPNHFPQSQDATCILINQMSSTEIKERK